MLIETYERRLTVDNPRRVPRARPTKIYLGRRYALEVLLDAFLSSRHVSSGPFASAAGSSVKPVFGMPLLFASVILDTLLCILVDSSARRARPVMSAPRSFSMLHRTDGKRFEFLYFYLDETMSSLPASAAAPAPSPAAPATPCRPTALDAPACSQHDPKSLSESPSRTPPRPAHVALRLRHAFTLLFYVLVLLVVEWIGREIALDIGQPNELVLVHILDRGVDAAVAVAEEGGVVSVFFLHFHQLHQLHLFYFHFQFQFHFQLHFYPRSRAGTPLGSTAGDAETETRLKAKKTRSTTLRCREWEGRGGGEDYLRTDDRRGEAACAGGGSRSTPRSVGRERGNASRHLVCGTLTFTYAHPHDDFLLASC
ncbi:hypothetical protein DFH08DRAFT_947948 [Mycena albidolilacea]|uniref:Uncharacterized protein n=1 Tax=Mycena albidolilacea TaxID=1033008 RepID=A0AAD7F7E2_9AGAR|nr:hypothetical protein DFH08DRAFT_947948 [Mycena albidolilacea]